MPSLHPLSDAGGNMTGPRHRLLVLTDISSLTAGVREPDDGQSMIRLMLYTNEIDVEGLVASSTMGHGQAVHPELIREVINAYARVWPALLQHSPDYPTETHLLDCVKAGQPIAGPGVPVFDSIGPGKDTEASEWIIAAADRPDARPLWIAVWGGTADLAQALWKVRQTRPDAEVAKFVRKIRVHTVYDQDSTGAWIKAEFPELFIVTRHHGVRGMYRGGDASLVSSQWVRENVHGHGALGDLYPDYDGGDIWGRVHGVKEGDTPSWLNLVAGGDPLDGWGGRFIQQSPCRWEEAAAEDARPTDADPRLAGVYCHRPAFQADFSRRLGWCVRPPALGALPESGSFRNTVPALQLSAEQKAALVRSLDGDAEFCHAGYDDAVKMLRRPFSSPGYHTTLTGGTVHSTRDAANYAVLLLDTGDAALEKRAFEVLDMLLSLQDADPASQTYGIWSWFLEEPLAAMAPPDYNWADFIGVQLLQVAVNHRHRLPAELAARLDAAIHRAAHAIRRRNVGPDYTNIAIMGTYVTLVAATLYAMPEMGRYALGRLRTFYEFTKRNGGFNEYNSPTYTIVALEELGRLKMHVQDAGAKPLVEELYHIAWEEIAHHYHAPGGQWAGPHSRTYTTLLADKYRDILERSLAGDLDPRLPLPLPEDLRPCFESFETPRTVRKVFTKGDTSSGRPDHVGTTYLHPKFALGSINWSDMWNQRRNLVAYWGTPQAPSYLALRFLHDGYDFSAMLFHGAQREGRVLAGLALATDGGDTHISLDLIKDATIRARDLRLRFEFGGAAANCELLPPAVPDAMTAVHCDGVHIKLAVPFAKFGDRAAVWQMGRDENRAWLDYAWDLGHEQSIVLTELHEAALAVAVQISAHDEPWTAPEVLVRDGNLEVCWQRLGLSVPTKPDKVALLRPQFNQGGTPL